MLRIAGLFRYPVKALGVETLDRATVEPMGLTGDRRWMVTTPEGRFLTRRELPRMALVGVASEAGGVVLRHPEAGECRVAEPGHGPRRQAKVWRDAVEAIPAGAAAAGWLSAVLGRPVELVFMPDTARRPIDPEYARETDRVSFADGFPLLITTRESLDALNRRLERPVEMARFRANIVLEGADAAFAEDEWRTLRIGALTLRVVKPCTRCIVTTQDPVSGAVVERGEPLRTLKAMGRVWGREPVFGQNAIPDGPGVIAVGDAVSVE